MLHIVTFFANKRTGPIRRHIPNFNEANIKNTAFDEVITALFSENSLKEGNICFKVDTGLMMFIYAKPKQIYFLRLTFWILFMILFSLLLKPCVPRYRTSILFLTFLFYTAYHLSRKPISIVKVTQTAPFPVFTSGIRYSINYLISVPDEIQRNKLQHVFKSKAPLPQLLVQAGWQ